MQPMPPTQMQPMQPMAPQVYAQPVRPGWLTPVLAFTGACTPGGFLFLIALATGSNINLDKPVWFILAAIGGGAGYWLGRQIR